MYNSPVDKKRIPAASYSLIGIGSLLLVFSAMSSFICWNISSKFSESFVNSINNYIGLQGRREKGEQGGGASVIFPRSFQFLQMENMWDSSLFIEEDMSDQK